MKMGDQKSVQQPFVVKKHRATRLHYDFRLGWKRVLISWAVPEGPSDCANHSREAIEVEDHKRENLGFEGVIPEGKPGAGPTMPWDWGTWEPEDGSQDVDASLRNGRLRFRLHGVKLNGAWQLVRRPDICTRSRRPVWDLIKEPDAFARSEHEPRIIDAQPNSVHSGKSLEEVEREWTEGEDDSDQKPTLF
jgi:bifunctional non-homologous end joining protein LigD